MENSENRVVNLRPPTQGTTPGVNVTRLATSVTAVARDLTLAGNLFGKRLRLFNEDATDSIWVAFGLLATPLIDKTAAGGATVALGTVATNAYRLAPGASLTVRLSKKFHAFIHIQSSANTPVLCIVPESPGVAGT